MLRPVVPFRMHKSGWCVVACCLVMGFQMEEARLALPMGLLLIASLLLHEVGHMWMATMFHVPVHEFGLRLAGAYNRRSYATRRRDEILISAAGPLMNLALVVPSLFLPRLGAQLALCNLLLMLCNLLPIPSSDGRRILRMVRHTGTPVQIALSAGG